MRGKTILAGLFALVMLTSCGGKPAAQVTATPSAPAPAMTETAASPSASAGVTLSGRPAVQNNGGYFLGLDDYVFYREYGEKALGATSVRGEFLPDLTQGEGGVLHVFDAKTGAETSRFSDDGEGRLWYSGDRLWLERLDGEVYHVYTISPDGTGRTEVAVGQVQGVSDSGELVCLQGDVNGETWSRLSLWRDGKEAAAVTPTEWEDLRFLGFAGEVMVYAVWDMDAESKTVWQLDETGKALRLGVAPVYWEGGQSAARLEQMVFDGRDVYLTLSWYDGMGQYFSGYRIVRMALNREDSLEIWEDGVESGEPLPDRAPVLLVSGEGDVTTVPAKPGTLSLSEGDYGHLVYADSPYSADYLALDFIRRPPLEEGGQALQIAEVVGDYAYLMVADTQPDPESEVPWRTELRLTALHYLRAPLAAGGGVKTLTGPDWNERDREGALFSVETNLTEEEITSANPAATVEIEGLDGGYFDRAQYWLLVTALEDGALFRVEAADLTGTRGSLTRILDWYAGDYLPDGSAPLWRGELAKGESVALRVTLPWATELRVSARLGNRFAQDILGQEDYLVHAMGSGSPFPVRYAVGEEQPDPGYIDGEGLWDFLDGSWVVFDPDTFEPVDILRFSKNRRTADLYTTPVNLYADADHLYTGTEEQPDLLRFHAGEWIDADLLPDWYGSDLGDYLVDCVVTDTEELVWLRQANNGDGVLTDLISTQRPRYSFLLHRYRGGACAKPVAKNSSFPALVWRYDRENYCLWLTGALEYEKDEEGQPVWCFAYDHSATAYPITSAEAIYVLRGAEDADYPMGVYWVTTDGEGRVTMLESPAYVDAQG